MSDVPTTPGFHDVDNEGNADDHMNEEFVFDVHNSLIPIAFADLSAYGNASLLIAHAIVPTLIYIASAMLLQTLI